jgi:hypothetical protein
MKREDQEPGIQLGFVVKNNATEAVRFKVITMTAGLGEATHASPTFDTDGATLGPGQGYCYWFPWFDGLEPRGGMKGVLHYVLHYGHPDMRPTYCLEHRQEIETIYQMASADSDKGEWRAAVRDLVAPTLTDLPESERWN